jgi:hypothetical protein
MTVEVIMDQYDNPIFAGFDVRYVSVNRYNGKVTHRTPKGHRKTRHQTTEAAQVRAAEIAAIEPDLEIVIVETRYAGYAF